MSSGPGPAAPWPAGRHGAHVSEGQVALSGSRSGSRCSTAAGSLSPARVLPPTHTRRPLRARPGPRLRTPAGAPCGAGGAAPRPRCRPNRRADAPVSGTGRPRNGRDGAQGARRRGQGAVAQSIDPPRRLLRRHRAGPRPLGTRSHPGPPESARPCGARPPAPALPRVVPGPGPSPGPSECAGLAIWARCGPRRPCGRAKSRAEQSWL